MQVRGGAVAHAPRILNALTAVYAVLAGKVEIYCSELERLGFPPLPVYQEPVKSPVSTFGVAARYPSYVGQELGHQGTSIHGSAMCRHC